MVLGMASTTQTSSGLPPLQEVQATQDRLLTVPEAADTLRVSERYLYLLFSRGLLNRVRLGRAVRVRASDVAHLVREGVPLEDPDGCA